jgi:hypothetical protein
MTQIRKIDLIRLIRGDPRLIPAPVIFERNLRRDISQTIRDSIALRQSAFSARSDRAVGAVEQSF